MLINSRGKTRCVKSVCIRSYCGLYFPAFGLNTERYGVSLRNQSKCGKIRTRITPNTDTFHTLAIWIISQRKTFWRHKILERNCMMKGSVHTNILVISRNGNRKFL